MLKQNIKKIEKKIFFNFIVKPPKIFVINIIPHNDGKTIFIKYEKIKKGMSQNSKN